jgi:hypothetical protein
MTQVPRRVADLSWRERWWLAQALFLLPATALALRVVPLRTLLAWANRASSAQPADKAPADRIAHMVAAAAHHGPYRASCVPQSLVLLWLLGRHDIRGELRHGVKKSNGTVAAHCWVELDGHPLIDSPQVTRAFSVLEPPAAASRWDR